MATTKKPTGVEFGAFEKGDQHVIALTLDDAVRFRFDGWQEIQPPAPDNVPPGPETSSE